LISGVLDFEVAHFALLPRGFVAAVVRVATARLCHNFPGVAAEPWLRRLCLQSGMEATSWAAGVPVEPDDEHGGAGDVPALSEAGQQLAKIFDFKGLSKLPSFSGVHAEYEEWKFRFMVMMTVLGLDKVMKEAENLKEAVPWSRLSARARSQSRLVYGILAQVLQGNALSLLRLCDQEEANGLEAWRRLTAEYEPRLGSRTVAQLSSSLDPKWHEGTDFVEAWRVWERQVMQYEGREGPRLS
jgi:hypothetical protein